MPASSAIWFAAPNPAIWSWTDFPIFDAKSDLDQA